MKKNLIPILFLCLVASTSIFAQNSGVVAKAYSTEDGIITFDANEPLSSIYEFDFSAFNYSKSEAQLITDSFEDLSIGLNTQLDFSNQKIMFLIDLTDPTVLEWDIKDWNKYLIKVQSKL